MCLPPHSGNLICCRDRHNNTIIIIIVIIIIITIIIIIKSMGKVMKSKEMQKSGVNIKIGV